SQLPDKYRVPVVLCDLEGRTRGYAARQLGIPVGTLSGRPSWLRQDSDRGIVCKAAENRPSSTKVGPFWDLRPQRKDTGVRTRFARKCTRCGGPFLKEYVKRKWSPSGFFA